ncbi:MAG: hypothetical protein HY286_00905 [Planctomycetes bacterium]|nr:hypothetical protein [Planctomycetota bacterium]
MPSDREQFNIEDARKRQSKSKRSNSGKSQLDAAIEKFTSLAARLASNELKLSAEMQLRRNTYNSIEQAVECLQAINIAKDAPDPCLISKYVCGVAAHFVNYPGRGAIDTIPLGKIESELFGIARIVFTEACERIDNKEGFNSIKKIVELRIVKTWDAIRPDPPCIGFCGLFIILRNLFEKNPAAMDFIEWAPPNSSESVKSARYYPPEKGWIRLPEAAIQSGVPSRTLHRWILDLTAGEKDKDEAGVVIISIYALKRILKLRGKSFKMQ